MNWFGRKKKVSSAGQKAVGPSNPLLECPPKLDANPGRFITGELQLARAGQNWTEALDVINSLAQVLNKRKHTVETGKECVRLAESGLLLRPSVAHLQLLDGGAIQTVTTIQTHHPVLVPQGVFEFQHATGNTLEAAISAGFDAWCLSDLPVFLDAVREKPQHCTFMDAEIPAVDAMPARRRRGILGPVGHYRKQPLSLQEEHSFCSCCFLTRSTELFRQIFNSEKTVAIRFYAARDENGVAGADCRINGEDFEEGKEALRQYVESWPQSGFEFRKQYVLLHSVTKSS